MSVHETHLIYRWIRWMAVCVLIGWMVSCGSNIRTCRDHGDCLAQEVCNWRNNVCVPQCNEDGDCLGGERCHGAFKVCVSECNEETDCLAGERCEPKQKVCVKTPCPSGRLQVDGKCPCIGQKDCTADTYCDSVGKTEGMCQAICPISGETPKEGKCPCPEGLVWLGWTCAPECSKTMVRRADGMCVPDLATLMPTAWEKIAEGEFRLKCPNAKYWKRDDAGQCKLELPEVPIVSLVPEGTEGKGPPSEEELRKKLGPQKPCPADTTDKWDEDYLKRENLPNNTAMVYVDASAAQGGDGTKHRPLRGLQEGVNQIAEGGVVLVAPGSYAWGLQITKRLHLVGRCTDGVKILPMTGSSGAGVDVTGPGVNLEGFSVLGMGQAPGYGIHIQQSGTSRLQHIHIDKAHGIGIVANTVVNITIQYAKVSETTRTSFGRGIHLESVSTKAMIRHNHILKNTQDGLFIGKSLEVEVQGNFISENGAQHKDGRGIGLQSLLGKAVLRYNHILKNAQLGLYISNGLSVEVEGNLISENGTQHKDGRGIGLQNLREKSIIRYNHILKNAQLGLYINNSMNVEVEGNLISENGTQNEDGRGIHLQNLQGKATLQRNHILKNTRFGLIVYNSLEVEVESNLILENGTQHQDGRGIHLQELQRKTVLRHNHILKNTRFGIYVSNGLDAEIEGNLVSEQHKEGRGIHLRELWGKAVLRYNHILKNTELGLYISKTLEVDIEGNLVSENGTQHKVSRGIYLQELQGKAVLRYNHILKNAQMGLFINESLEAEVEGNLISENGTQHKDGLGINLQGLQGNSIIQNNTFVMQPIGGIIFGLIQDGGVKLQGNWWGRNQHIGLELRENFGSIHTQSENLFHNGNTHLRILGNRSSLHVQYARFVGGTFSKGILDQGQGWSTGMGIWVGTLGLVRWVFAKDADYSCSPTQKGLVAPLPQGWTMRPLRIPYEFDPCKVWKPSLYRTEKAAQQASLCGKYCGRRKCRWVWENVGGRKKGLWEPRGLECLFSNAPDTCETPISSHLPLQSVYSETFVSGQCVELTFEDPCNSSEMQACNQKTDEDGNRLTYCFRTKEDPKQPIQAYCANWDELNKSCRPPTLPGEQEPCGSGQVCVSEMKVSWPMDVSPSRLFLEKSIFWGNPGPDVMMDMAGDVRLTDNQYHLCIPSATHPNCALKVGYQSCVPSPEDPKCEASTDGKIGYKKFQLPAGATIVWQNPSPYDAPYDSKLQGNDLDRTIAGQALFYKPNTCEELSTQ